MRLSTVLAGGVAVIAFSSVLAGGASAQTAPQSDNAAQVDDIVVTAR